MYFNSNIKLMRKRRGRTQNEVASTLNMKRPTLSGYENGVAQPGIRQLIAYLEYFGISIDTLIKVDLSKLRESGLHQLESGFDVFVKGSKLRVLTTTVDSSNNDNTELTLDEGIVFKIIEKKIGKEGKIGLISLNPAYKPTNYQWLKYAKSGGLSITSAKSCLQLKFQLPILPAH